jgi:Leucine-rich repeat (LRR) protein
MPASNVQFIIFKNNINVITFLAVLLLCSCSTQKKDTQPPVGLDGNALPAIPEIAHETTLEKNTGENNNPNQYTFRFSNDTYYDINDLTYFLADTSIKKLRLYRGTFHDLSPLAELTDLEELDITGNRYITDISPIGALVNLKKLMLFNEYYEGGIEALSSLVNLRYLDLLYKNKYYRELLPLKNLEELYLHNISPSQLDVSYIAQLRSLKVLGISNGTNDVDGIMNIRQLGNLVNLERIFISGAIDLDISWIIRLQKLRKLELRVNRIDDISPLLELPNLVDVDLHETVVRDILPLSESRSIKSITGFVLENTTGEMDILSLFWDRGIEFIPFYSDR